MTTTATIPPGDPTWWVVVGLLLSLGFFVAHAALVTLLLAPVGAS